MKYFFKKGDALFGFFKSGRNKNGEIVFRPVLGRVLVVLFGLGLAGWLSAAFAIMIFVKYARDFDGGKYTDLLFYPWRKEAYQKVWGDEFIERGMALLEEGEFREGLHLIRVGHNKSPTNLEGRLVMGEFSAARGRPDLAAKVLRGGLPYAKDNLDYLRTTLRVLISNQDDEAVQEIAETILGEEGPLTPRVQVTALAAATAYFHRGGYDRAEDLIVEYELTGNPEGRILLARIDWERGRKETALKRLRALSERNTDQEEVYMLLTHYYRELGDHTKAHNYAVMRQINNPLSAAPRIALLYSHHAAGESDQVERQTEQLLRDFGHDSAALGQVGEFAANTGNVELCRRVFQALDKGGFPLDRAAMLLAEAHLNAREFREAIRFLESYSRQSETFSALYGAAAHGIYAVAHLAQENNDQSEMHLSQFLEARDLRADNFLLTSRRIMDLTEGGNPAVARRILLHAHRKDPLNQAALAELIRLDLGTGRTDHLVANIQKLLTMRKPPRALLQESFSMLSADQFLFLPERDQLLQSLDQLIGEAGPAEEVTHS